jgi:hypothetical protein
MGSVEFGLENEHSPPGCVGCVLRSCVLIVEPRRPRHLSPASLVVTRVVVEFGTNELTWQQAQGARAAGATTETGNVQEASGE